MEYLQFHSVTDNEWLPGLLQLHESIFKDSDTLVGKMETKPGLILNVAVDKGKVIGYKIGYKLDNDTFYSWLGGVDKNSRKYGVATKLMENQHLYLKENGYKIVQTKTMNKWRNMLILNIKSGFDVIDTYIDKNGETKIILEKKLFES